ncbi:MAG TPA: D-alanyl-D-alanine carboxypeptidase/D-alanyl-D-alanine-endopeptidase [Ignavibacteriaceae bacterium]|nr:D-alanyl-D-alanine carboxypeptidase/D-alanyl-D-alanine-endopeptidase [Ignavibacteriaceae bacterium]
MLKKYLFLIVLLFLAPRIFPQINKEQLRNEIDTLLRDDFFKSANIAIEIYDLTAYDTLYKFNEKKLLNPASNMKLLTSAAGLIFLGPRHNFFTSVRYTGDVIDHTLHGDVYVDGDFDPDIGTGDLYHFINDFLKLGIEEIDGNLYADISKKDTISWGWGWMWDDNPSTDAPYLSPLNINSNAIDVYVLGTVQGEKAQIFTDPETEYVRIINNTITSSLEEQNIYVTRDWQNRNNDIYVGGIIAPPVSAAGDTIKRSVNIYRPDLYFLTLLKEKLQENGITLKGKMGVLKNPSGSRWLSFFNHTYDNVMTYMNKVSDNLSAEMVLYTLAESFNGVPVTASEGLRVIDSLLTLSGVPRNTYLAADGSGVSRYNLFSADHILSVLKYIYYNYQRLFELYYNSLPIAGIDGTLRNRMQGTDAEGNVHAKTGTLRGVSCLSGYAKAKNNHLIAFSILMQGFIYQTDYARSIQDRICILISNYIESK